jgi:hypothetical protein
VIEGVGITSQQNVFGKLTTTDLSSGRVLKHSTTQGAISDFHPVDIFVSGKGVKNNAAGAAAAHVISPMHVKHGRRGGN